MFFLLAALTLVLHANTRLQDYPSPPAIAGRACVCENVFRWRVLSSRCNLSVFRGHCAPCEVPELPSNITCGLWFDPKASRSPQPPSKQIVINEPVIFWVVGGRGGGCGVYNLRVLISHARVWVRGAGKGWGRLGSPPIRSLKGLFPFPAASQLKAVFNLRKQSLFHTSTPVNPCHQSSAGFFLGSEKMGINDVCFHHSGTSYCLSAVSGAFKHLNRTVHRASSTFRRGRSDSGFLKASQQHTYMQS